ncbi:MAG: CsiV family protein, partial [Pseudomonadota bacterium]
FRNAQPYTQEVFPKKDTFGDATVAAYEFLDGEIVAQEQGPVYGEFEPAPETHFQLNDAVERLERASNYDLIAHLAWIQPGFGRDDAMAQAIQTDEEAFQALSGTATLSVSNYLHLDMDLILDGDDLSEYQLREKRKMRRDEAHYFDHPHLGIIAVVRRLEEIEEELLAEASEEQDDKT